MSKIDIGKNGAKDVKIDLDILLSTRLLIQANSGGGKSYAIRRLIEQSFGKVQQIVIDPEGEFATLREKFGFVLVGQGGETPADTRSAAMVAEKLLELNASAVCDIYELKTYQRHQWVRSFLEAMINAPKKLWHPCLVIVDEAHVFCPEKGQGESEAAGAMTDLATRGRKRGFCAIFATQRLGKLSKNASAELQNRMIGPTFEDIDRKRASELLGVIKSDEREFFKQIQLLEPGNFFALGRAIALERIIFKVGSVETTHPQIGTKMKAPPAPPDSIAKLLPQLADLPKEAEEKAKTVAELQKQIRDLKAELAKKPAAEVDAKAIERAVRDATAPFIRSMEAIRRQAKQAVENIARAAAPLNAIANLPEQELPKPAVYSPPAPTAHKAIAGGLVPIRAPRASSSNGDSSLGGTKTRILSCLAELMECTRERAIRKEQLAAWSKFSPNSGGFNNYLSELRTGGYIEYPTPGFVTLTEQGQAAARPEAVPATSREMLERAKRVLGGREGSLLETLHELRSPITKADLAERNGFSPNSGGFNNYLSHMRTSGFIDYPQPGSVKASDWLYLEG